MNKKEYITPGIEPLSLPVASLLAGSVERVQSSEGIQGEVDGSNEPARAKGASFWDSDWQE